MTREILHTPAAMSPRQYLDLTQTIMVALDAEGHIVMINRAGQERLGYTEEELLGRNWFETCLPQPDGMEMVLPVFRRIMAGELAAARNFENPVICRDGTRRLIRWQNAEMRDETGRIIGALSSGEDITDRKRAEESLRDERQIFMGGPTVVFKWLAVAGWPVAYVSPNVVRVLGYAPDDLLSGQVNYVRLIHPDDLARVLQEVRDYNASGDASYEQEYRLAHADGSYRWFHDYTRPVRNADGQLLYYHGYVQDITDRKEAEAAILQLKKSESLGRMAGAVAHHYNNLMSAVLGNLELAADPGVAPAEAANRMADASSAAQRAADISRLMLAYLGQSLGTRKPLDLTTVSREALDAIAPRLLGNARLETSCTPPGPVVRADAAQIRQVLEALVTNAAEALGKTGGTITVTVGKSSVANVPAGHLLPMDWQPSAGPHACLSVADTGSGMAPEILEQAFDPFFSTRFTGRGLGLPVVLGIVKAHGGAVSVESRPGEGTVVHVFLPLSDDQPQDRPSTGTPAAPLAGQDLVLVVDDEPTLRSLAQGMLKRLGYESIGASNGADAVDIFRQHPQKIRCVLCDLTMPVMSGWQTLTALRQIRADVPVILCSGYDEASVMADARTDLPQAFLSKPYGRKSLSDALAKALGDMRHDV